MKKEKVLLSKKMLNSPNSNKGRNRYNNWVGNLYLNRKESSKMINPM